MGTRYEIVVDGTVGPMVTAALDGFEVVSATEGRSRLVGTVVDQAALQGALHRLHDLQVDIVDVHRVDEA
jgi:hypothetical protein